MAIDEAESWTPVEWVINSVKVRNRLALFSSFLSWEGGYDWSGLVTDEGRGRERLVCTSYISFDFMQFFETSLPL